MERLDFVRDGDTGRTGLGYNVVNINAVGADREITPLYSKTYGYEVGVLSSNRGINDAVRQVGAHVSDKNCWVIDRDGDNRILKDFFTSWVQLLHNKAQA